MNETMTLDDLIRRGVEIREQRIAEERARLTAIQEVRARERAENARLILELLPSPLVEYANVDVFSEHAYVRISRPFPGAGSVKIYAHKDRVGVWSLCGYEATNPNGYYLKLPTLEEAVAYAAGVLEI
jgi:hypothetical protein